MKYDFEVITWVACGAGRSCAKVACGSAKSADTVTACGPCRSKA